MTATVTAPAGSTVLAITGWSVLSSIGVGPEAFGAAIADGTPGVADVSEMFPDDPIPRADAFAMPTFKAKDFLGRKGTSHLDRSTALAMVACGEALKDTDLDVNDDNRERVGLVMGTTAGSVKATSDISKATFIEDKPYLINPLTFPNVLMNSASGQSAIRYNLRGVNSTIAAGQVAAFSVLRYARHLIGLGRSDALLVGTVEEFGPQIAWFTQFAMQAENATTSAGEGAAVFVVEDAATVRAAGRRPDAEVLAMEVLTHIPADEDAPEEDFSDSLVLCLARALERAGVTADQVWAVASADNGMARCDAQENAAIERVLGTNRERLRIKELTGEAHSASNAFQIAALLARHRADAALDGKVSVITSRTPDGVVGAAVLRGWSRHDRAAD
jgi:3-oxoacyl-[acyl-carrier-protein] synthase II